MNTPEQLQGWQARRLAIAEHYRKSGSLRATGREFGITAERVRQIVNRIGKEPADGQDNAGGSDAAPAAGTGVLR